MQQFKFLYKAPSMQNSPERICVTLSVLAFPTLLRSGQHFLFRNTLYDTNVWCEVVMFYLLWGICTRLGFCIACRYLSVGMCRPSAQGEVPLYFRDSYCSGSHCGQDNISGLCNVLFSRRRIGYCYCAGSLWDLTNELYYDYFPCVRLERRAEENRVGFLLQSR